MPSGDLWQYDLSLHGGQFQQWFQGLMIASTTDNVAVSALAAVSQFGLLVPLSRAARIDVEKAATVSGSATVKFLKASVGFSAGDVADYLSQSEGGVRFLGLAAALLCTSDNLFAGAALDRMLQATRSPTMDARALPTNRQLVDTLQALEPKLSRSSFAESLCGWQVYLGNLPGADPTFAQRFRDDGSHPTVDMLQALVSAFRHIDRIGEVHETGGGALGSDDGATPHVEIRAYNALPWITAFTKWSLGYPPSIRLLDGSWLVRQDASVKVELLVVHMVPSKEDVRLVYPIKEPTTLWNGWRGGEGQNVWNAMMPISDYGRLRLLNVCSSDEESRALHQALSYSLPKIASQLWPTTASDIVAAGNVSDSPYHPAQQDPRLAKYRAQMFPDDRQILRTFQEYTGATTGMASREGSLFLAPAIRTYEDRLAKQCPHQHCLERTGRVAKGTHQWEGTLGGTLCALKSDCPVNNFRLDVAMVSAEILALSLFDCSDPVRVFWPGRSAALTRIGASFRKAVETILQSAEESVPGFCRVPDVLSTALDLVGHDVRKEVKNGTWIASAGRGQVFYPVLFDTGILDKSGVLLLGGGLGRLTFGGDTYEKVLGHVMFEIHHSPLPAKDGPPVLQPLCLFDNEILDWQVKRRANRNLELTFGPTSYNKVYNPFDALTTAARSLFVTCDHPQSRPLVRPCEDACFSREPLFKDKDKDRNGYSTVEATRQKMMEQVNYKTEIIAVAKNDPLRLFAMANTSMSPGVVRYGACLECCLNVCTTASLPYIIL